MAFLGGLFKRKPGGTFFGNLIRGVANKATGGILGTGSGMISQQDADKRDMNDQDYSAKYGLTKEGLVVPTANPANNALPAPSSSFDLKVWIKAHSTLVWTGVVILGLGIVALVIHFIKKKGGRRSYRR